MYQMFDGKVHQSRADLLASYPDGTIVISQDGARIKKNGEWVTASSTVRPTVLLLHLGFKQSEGDWREPEKHILRA